MITAWVYAIIGVVFVSLLSFLGALTLAVRETFLRKILIYFVSFSAGAILGDVFIHLLPEIARQSGFTLATSFYFLFGIILSFIVEKAICWKHSTHESSCHEHHHVQRFTYMILLGDAFHNFIDGLMIGVGFLTSIPIGIGITTAVVLHEIPHEIGDFGVLLHGGLEKRRALFLNFFSALTAIVGTILALLLGEAIKGIQVFLLCFAASNLLYIATSNLIPELHKESQVNRDLVQIASIVLGILVMLPLLLLE